MRHIFSIIILFISISVFGQYVRYDSTVIHQNRLIYNNAGYYIGKDSLHTKRVRLVYCNDTVTIDYDTLILRTPLRFITMDSIGAGGGCTECGVPLADMNDSLRAYLQRSASDTIFGDLYISDRPGFPHPTYPYLKLESVVAPYVIEVGSNNGISMSRLGEDATMSLQNSNMQINREGEYTPSGDNEVLIQGEIKTLISDSIATRPTIVDVRSEISDSIATVSAPDLTDYVTKSQNDTITGIKVFGKVDSIYTRIQPYSIYMKNEIDFPDLSINMSTEEGFTFSETGYGFVSFNQTNIIVSDNASKNTTINNDHITIDRDGYSATGATEVPIVSEVKALINDSLDTRLASYTTNTDLEEKIQDQIGTKIIEGSGITRSYNDATGETTLSVTGGSGLTSEQIFDTLAYSIRVGEGLNKTKSDTGDSLYIELKFKNALERVVYGAGCHKSVFMATNTTGGTAHWGFQITATGTVTAPTKSTTNRFQFANRWETLVTSASTTAVAGFRTNATTHGFGNASGMGGFYYNSVTGAATGLSNSNARYFSGFSNSVSAPTDVDPSTLTNIFGIGYDDTDANLQFMHNDASGTATKVDLGSNFAVTTSDRTNFYRLIMYAEPNTTTVYYKVIDMTDGDTYTGSVNTDLPSSTTFFGPYGYTSVGGSSAVTGFSIMSIEVFTDF